MIYSRSCEAAISSSAAVFTLFSFLLSPPVTLGENSKTFSSQDFGPARGKTEGLVPAFFISLLTGLGSGFLRQRRMTTQQQIVRTRNCTASAPRRIWNTSSASRDSYLNLEVKSITVPRAESGLGSNSLSDTSYNSSAEIWPLPSSSKASKTSISASYSSVSFSKSSCTY